MASGNTCTVVVTGDLAAILHCLGVEKGMPKPVDGTLVADAYFSLSVDEESVIFMPDPNGDESQDQWYVGVGGYDGIRINQDGFAAVPVPDTTSFVVFPDTYDPVTLEITLPEYEGMLPIPDGHQFTLKSLLAWWSMYNEVADNPSWVPTTAGCFVHHSDEASAQYTYISTIDKNERFVTA